MIPATYRCVVFATFLWLDHWRIKYKILYFFGSFDENVMISMTYVVQYSVPWYNILYLGLIELNWVLGGLTRSGVGEEPPKIRTPYFEDKPRRTKHTQA